LKFVIFQKNGKLLLFLLISLTFPRVFYMTLNSLTFPCFPESINPGFFLMLDLQDGGKSVGGRLIEKSAKVAEVRSTQYNNGPSKRKNKF
jgi:hypothetical protein